MSPAGLNWRRISETSLMHVLHAWFPVKIKVSNTADQKKSNSRFWPNLHKKYIIIFTVNYILNMKSAKDTSLLESIDIV